ncbi:MAG: 5-(carboxyamino)imidazole ribonucleotide mutase [Clostridia bacterium]|nr:5-(carboxyamino)imidazole ribonucleotide mutase [Clostridia bacterium]MCL6521724.1 5-(carboxyamino)imidazole ribonucleotide mutase [Bacillota bacterium]
MPHVALLVGSASDIPRVAPCLEELQALGISCEQRVLSAHRTPAELAAYVREAEARGVRLFVAAAGLSAALPGAVAAQTVRPVVGLPLAAGPLGGWDALLSVVQMPPGVPVAAVGVDAARNAAFLAASILALEEPELAERLRRRRQEQAAAVLEADRRWRGEAAAGAPPAGAGGGR